MPLVLNPILPGFNADPSILRVGDDYYIATSTFEWYPGVQIHHSKDLANWDLVTRPLNRKSQLDMRGDPDSCGVWAPVSLTLTCSSVTIGDVCMHDTDQGSVSPMMGRSFGLSIPMSSARTATSRTHTTTLLLRRRLRDPGRILSTSTPLALIHRCFMMMMARSGLRTCCGTIAAALLPLLGFDSSNSIRKLGSLWDPRRPSTVGPTLDLWKGRTSIREVGGIIC